MVKILQTTPFGFVAELENGFCYSGESRTLYLNGKAHGEYAQNVISVFGLASGTEYQAELKGPNGSDLFEVQTQRIRYKINVRDYNALGDGVANDTAAINLAIYLAPAGSVVCVPKGRYKVDLVLLKSGVDLYLELGAVLLHNTERASLGVVKAYQRDFDFEHVTVNGSWEGNPLDCYCGVIYGKDVENVRIYGEGIIDGNGDAGGWWQNPKVKNVAFRPKNIMLVNCRDIEISGITSQNSACWNMHPFYCENIRLIALHLKSCASSPNTDGIDPESCENVEIIGCRFSVGDDCVAIKSGKIYMSRRHFKRTRNIIVRNCLMEQGHGGVTVGSEISCGASGVIVSQCRFVETDRGLRIKTRRGRGACSEIGGILFSNVEMRGVRHPLVVNMFYNCDPDGNSEYVGSKAMCARDDGTPSVGDITFKHVTATEISGAAVFAYGLPESPIREITVEACSFSFADTRVAEPPAMMADFTPIETLGVFLENVASFHFAKNKITGTHVNIINGKEHPLGTN